MKRVLPFRSAAANMTEAERVLRFVVGLLGTPIAYAVIVRPLDGVLAMAALALIVIGGIDLLVSGVRGYCPVYRLISVPWSRPPSSVPGTGSTADLPGRGVPTVPSPASKRR